AENGRLRELFVNEVDAIREPVFHPVHFGLKGAAAKRDAPAGALAWLGGANLVGELVDQRIDVRARELLAARFLPPIHPFLPKIAITEKFGPPAAAEERPCIPIPWVVVTPVRRSERAVEIPMRTKHNLAVARLMEVSAEHERVHIA